MNITRKLDHLRSAELTLIDARQEIARAEARKNRIQSDIISACYPVVMNAIREFNATARPKEWIVALEDARKISIDVDRKALVLSVSLFDERFCQPDEDFERGDKEKLEKKFGKVLQKLLSEKDLRISFAGFILPTGYYSR